MAKSKTKSTHTDGSSGEKMSVDKKNTCPRCVKGKLVPDDETGEKFCSKCGLVKKPIETFVGKIENEDQKESVFHELNRVEDTKVKDAERALFRRLGKDARCDAWVWSQYYKEMVGDPSG